MTEGLPQAFAAECEKIALRLRSELDLDSQDRLDPRRVAAHLEIGVVSIERYRDTCPDAVALLTEKDKGAFAAASVFCGTRCLIIVNPSQSDTEMALSIAHEIAHRELEHEPTWPLFDQTGRGLEDHEQEEAEAEHLARAILVPEKGLEPVLARCGGNALLAAAHFGVSVKLMRRRIEEVGRRPAQAPPDRSFTAEPELVLRRLVGRGDGEPAPASSPAT